MPKFKKGHKKFGGRKPGVPNKATASIKDLLNELLPREELVRLWKNAIYAKDRSTRMKAFEMANHYLFGKPVLTVGGHEDALPIKIDISAIPQHREPAKQ